MEEATKILTPMGEPGKPEDFSHMIQLIVENTYLNGVSLKLSGA